ncbi:MAG: hypothetical protein IJI80_02855 [Methanobrevibacter sp.]|uniref:hypothetical protein n=1 Tax=Methanobrevibacter sp. TaxID=66852 RepID=UPI0025EE5F8D|nr:hypothetical protein [Methanobrevibacter sp.]MBQ6138601.1 hypothetical protein [Methanobrevibacter sp.]
MYSYSIAMSWKGICLFDENSHLVKHILKGGAIISVQSKIWMALVVYLIYLGCMTFIIIMVMLKLL